MFDDLCALLFAPCSAYQYNSCHLLTLLQRMCASVYAKERASLESVLLGNEACGVSKVRYAGTAASEWFTSKGAIDLEN